MSKKFDKILNPFLNKKSKTLLKKHPTNKWMEETFCTLPSV
jgi:hypothetical protein